MYESKAHPPIPRNRFLERVFLHVASAALPMLGSLLSGKARYEGYEGLPWRDAFLNSAM